MKIRADIVRTYQTLHTWTGITTGLLLFIGFFAGALVMFTDTIDQWSTPPNKQFAQVSGGQHQVLLNHVLENEEKAINAVTLHYSDNHSPITWHEEGNGRGVNVNEQVWHAGFNEHGEIQKELSQVNHLSGLLDYLHQTGGIFGEIGHHLFGGYILGIASFLYFIALVSGLIFLLPTLVKSFFALRKDKSASRFWLDSHNLIGVSSLPFHIVIAFTVFVFAFHDFLYGGLFGVYGDKKLFPEPQKSEYQYSIKELPSLDDIKAKIQAYAPGYQIERIALSRLNTSSPSASVNITHPREMMRGPTTDFIFMHPYTLEINVSSLQKGDQGIWVSIVSSLFALHFGSYGGTLGQWAYFVMGLLGALLFYTGNLLWIEKRRKQKLAKQSKSSLVLAKLTVGIALGCICAISLAFAATKWLSLTSLNVNIAYLWIYYVTFFAVVVASFIKGPSITTIYTLKISTIFCLIIPLNSIVALLIPQLGLWYADSFTEIMLEIVALPFAWFFYVCASKVAKRAYKGEKNSVWYVSKKAANTTNEELVIHS
jgi:uncharacterized iron-regulated membrane protein